MQPCSQAPTQLLSLATGNEADKPGTQAPREREPGVHKRFVAWVAEGVQEWKHLCNLVWCTINNILRRYSLVPSPLAFITMWGGGGGGWSMGMRLSEQFYRSTLDSMKTWCIVGKIKQVFAYWNLSALKNRFDRNSRVERTGYGTGVRELGWQHTSLPQSHALLQQLCWGKFQGLPPLDFPPPDNGMGRDSTGENEPLSTQAHILYP